MPTTTSGGPNCDHPITSMQPLEGTPFTECLSCNAIFEDVEEAEDAPHFTGTLVCDPVDKESFFARQFSERASTSKIREVTRHDGEHSGYSITGEDSTGFILSDEKNPQGYEPKVGDEITLYVFNGSIIKGVKIAGRTVYHYSDDEQRESDWNAAVERNRTKAREFYEKRGALDRDYDSLPDVFKRRIDKYRTNNPTFRTSFEGYEMGCLVDAVRVADHLRPKMEKALAHAPDVIFEWANEDVPEAEREEKITETLQEFAASEFPEAFQQNVVAWKVVADFNKLPYEQQKEFVDGGHSGNSHSMVMRMAWLYLAGRDDDIVQHHGAMAALVGSDEYGDVPREEVAV